MEVKFNKPKYRIRCFAFLFDLMTIAISFCLLFFLSLTIMNHVPYYKNANELIDNIQFESHLYIKDENRNRLLCDYYVVKEEDDYKKYYVIFDEALTSFYSDEDFFTGDEGIKIYSNLKIKEGESLSDLFIYSDESHSSIVVQEDASSKDVYNWFSQTMVDTASTYVTSSKEYIEASKTISLSFYFIILLLPLTISFLIFEYIIPLIISRGKKTLGKLVFSLAVVSADGLSCSFSRFTCRFLIFFFLEILLSIVAFLIPLFISFSMFVFSKLGQSMHDYIAATYVVEAPLKSICKTKEEYLLKHQHDENFVLNKDRVAL